MTASLETADELETVRDELMERRLRLLASLDDDLTQELDDGEAAPQIDPAEVLMRGSLRELDAAIARIDTGDFGRCEDCGGAIHEDRLAALPETAYCVEYQARREI